MNIYQIEQELLAIFDEIEDNYGELTPELEEKLKITRDSFKTKIKSYSDVIKLLTTDITSIKEEIDRLKDLQKSKEKTIDRLKKIIISAVEEFGDINKNGNKFIDFGTGKISIRNTEAIEIKEGDVDRFTNRFISCLKWYADNNQLDASLVATENVMEYVNSKSPSEEEDNTEILQFDIKDIERLNASIDLDINIKYLISTEKGINLLRSLLAYNNFKIKAKADKKGIKDDAKGKEHYMPTYAKLVNNKSVTIK